MKPWKNLPALGTLCALLLIAISCNLGTPPERHIGTEAEGLHGTLVDQRGTPVGGAWVRVYAAPDLALGKRAAAASVIVDSAQTNAAGRFSFPGLLNGTYNIVASARRGDSTIALLLRGVIVTGTQNLGTDTLKVTGGITLQLQSQGQPLDSALCSIPGTPFQAQSDIAGTCVLGGLPPGTFQIQLSYGGLTVAVSGDLQVLSGLITPGGVLELLDAAGSPSDSDNSSLVRIRLAGIPTRVFVDGISSKAAAQAAFPPLAKLVLTFTSTSGDTLRDTLSASTLPALTGDGADSQVIVKRYPLAPLRLWKLRAVATDSRGRETHAGQVVSTVVGTASAGIFLKLPIEAKDQRSAFVFTVPDSLHTPGSGAMWGLYLNRFVIRDNGAVGLDTTLTPSFPGGTPSVFALTRPADSAAHTFVFAAHGAATGGPYALTGDWNPDSALFVDTLVVAPGDPTPELKMTWKGPVIAGPLYPPALVSPADQAVNQPRTLSFSWTASQDVSARYQVQVATDAGFASIVARDSSLTAPTFIANSLSGGILHYWRVRAHNSRGPGEWSATRTFTAINPETLVVASQDALIWGSVPSRSGFIENIDKNAGKGEYFEVGVYDMNTMMRSLLKFEIPAGLSGAQINSAVIRLTSFEWFPKNVPPDSVRIDAHALLKNWKEGTGTSQDGRTNSALVDGVTGRERFWGNQDGGEDWSQKLVGLNGTDAVAVPAGSATRPRSYLGSWDIEVTALAKAWADDPSRNFGVVLAGAIAAADSLTEDYPLFYSKDAGVADSLKPQLILNRRSGVVIDPGPPGNPLP